MAGIEKGRVCIFGAGGQVGAVSAPVLGRRYALRLVDRTPLRELLARPRAQPPQWTEPPQPPHEWVEADITDYAQVERAMEGCDGVVNLSVVRGRPEVSFRVNAVGAYNIMKAAAKLGTKRIVQTGMILAWGNDYEGDHRFDFRLPDDLPLHPGSNLYGLSKQLGHEIVTVFAREHGLDALTLVFHRLRPHDATDGREDDVVVPYSTAFDDMGGALECALKAPAMPRPNEMFYICGHIPTGKYSPNKAKRLLGWEPQHNFDAFYDRRFARPDQESRRSDS